MKIKYLILTFFMLLTCSSQAQINKIMEKYASQENVTSINISSKMFQLIGSSVFEGNINLNGLKEKGLDISKITSLQMLTTENKNIGQAIAKDLTKEVKNNYEELMRIKDEENVVFYAKIKKEKITDLIMWIHSPNMQESTLIYITGIFSLKEMSKIK